MRELDPASLELRPLAEYARALPSRRIGHRLNRATLWRWALRGTRNGRYLRTVVLGAGRMTCDAWVCEFMGHGEAAVAPLDRSFSARDRERVRRQLGARPSRDGRSASRPPVDRTRPSG